MIMAFLEVINDPRSYAMTYRKGEFHVASIEDLKARGARIIGLPTVEVDGTPEPEHETHTAKVEPNAER